MKCLWYFQPDPLQGRKLKLPSSGATDSSSRLGDVQHSDKESAKVDRLEPFRVSTGDNQAGVSNSVSNTSLSRTEDPLAGTHLTVQSMFQNVDRESLMDVSTKEPAPCATGVDTDQRPIVKGRLKTEDSGLGTSFAYSSSQGSFVSPSDVLSQESSVFSSSLTQKTKQWSPMPGTSRSPVKMLTNSLEERRKFTPPRPLRLHHQGFAASSVPFLPRSPRSPMKRRRCSVSETMDVCMICMSKPKEASIIHGKTGHQVCCYVCAKQLRRRGKPCPVCRRPIQKVIKNFLV